jgi:hypothetical protein
MQEKGYRNLEAFFRESVSLHDHKSEAEINERPFKLPELETFELPVMNKTTPLYHIVFNSSRDDSLEETSKANFWSETMLLPMKKKEFSRAADFITKMEAHIPKLENINNFLTHSITFTVGECILFKGSFRLSNLLYKLRYPHMISKHTEDTWVVPLFVFSRKLFELWRTSYSPIVYSSTAEIPFKMRFCSGFYDSKYRRRDTMMNSSICPSLCTNTVPISSLNKIPIIWKNQLFGLGIVIWNIIDTSELSEMQELAPRLVSAKITMDNYCKDYNILDIDLVKHDKYVAYFIPLTNQIRRLKDIITFIEHICHYKDLDIEYFMDDGFIPHKMLIDKTYLELNWDGGPTNEIVIELLGMDIFNCYGNISRRYLS